MPKVVTANRLRDGMVVYLARSGWSRHLHEARIAETEDEIAALEADAKGYVEAQIVVELYAFDVIVEEGVPMARSVRERIRAAHSPTIIEGTNVPLR